MSSWLRDRFSDNHSSTKLDSDGLDTGRVAHDGSLLVWALVAVAAPDNPDGGSHTKKLCMRV